MSTPVPVNESTTEQSAGCSTRKVFKGGALLLLSKLLAQLCMFIRNIIIARCIGVEDFGIAATFSIMIAVMDMLGSLSVDRMLVQAADGDDVSLQSTAHCVQALRGIGSGAMMLIAAWPIAQLFGIPKAGWAFAALATVPVFRGFSHLDVQRVQRRLRYGPIILLESLQQLIPTLLAWPIAAWRHDYSAMLWLIILQNAIGMIVSFAVARRPYRWRWNVNHVKRFFSFGWPLFINSLLLFFIYQGDRFLIGTAGKSFGHHVYSLADLGIYSVAYSLAMAPMVALGGICSSLLLPIFSRARDNGVQFLSQYSVASGVIAVASGLIAVAFILMGGTVVIALYGNAYARAASFIGWLGAAQAIRMARFTPSMAAMACGDTENAMYANAARITAIAFTFFVLFLGGDLMWVAISGFVGELLGLTTCVWNLKRRHGLPVNVTLRTVGPVIAVLLGASVITMRAATLPVIVLLPITIGTAVILVSAVLLSCPALRLLPRRTAIFA